MVETGARVSSRSGDATVTFLFVAVGDSAGRSRAEGFGQQRVALIRDAVAACGGRDLDVTTTSYPAAFPTPSAALECARRILADAKDLKAAIHCGEPLAIEEGRYFGAAVWLTARLAGEADTGHILVSRTARDLLIPAATAALEPAGTVRLKGIADDVEVCIDRARSEPGGAVRPPDRAHVLSVLGVDQVGSTALIQDLGDRGAVLVHAALMDAIREALLEHGGTEIEYGGDGIAARFDAAISALSCAAAVRAAAGRHRRRFPQSRLLVRAAVVSGEADPGAAAAVDRLLGDVERELRLAEPDEVLASRVTAALARDRRAFSFHAGPAPDVLRLERSSDIDERPLPQALRSASVFVGREAEASSLVSTIDAGARDRMQQVAVVEGAAGAGKTALLARAAAHAAAQDALVLYGRCPQLETRPAEPLVDALGGVVRAASRADLRRMADGQVDSLIGAFPFVAARFPGVRPRPVDADETAALVNGLLGVLCMETPVVLVLDDLHRASGPVLRCLRVIVEAAPQRPLVLLGALRPAADLPIDALLRDAGAAGASASRIDLGPLRPEDVTELVAEISGTRLDPDDDLLRAPGTPGSVIAAARSRAKDAVRTALHAAAAGPADGAEVLRLSARLLQLEEDRLLRPGQTADTGGSRDEGALPPVSAPNPYRGLEPYSDRDGAWFFGRERMTAELIARVALAPVVAVVGASGSGKSSLVRAGLLPALRRDALPGSAEWAVAVMVPGEHPVHALEAAVKGAIGAAAPDRDLAGTIAESTASKPLLVVVDQAEELFVDTAGHERDRFVRILERAVASTAGRFHVLLVTRAEFYGSWAAYPGFGALVERGHLLVRAMTDAEIRRAIEAPAARAGVLLHGALVDAVIADVAGESGALPLLSAAMHETFERRGGSTLTLLGYARSGGVRGAIARAADAVYAAADDEQRRAARRLLLRLARTSPTDPATDLRRRAPLVEIQALGPRAAEMSAAFVAERLLVVEDGGVEVAHEALLREWPLLREWLDEDRAARILQQDLAADADRWRERDRDSSLLYRGARLAAALEYDGANDDALTPIEREFVQSSTVRSATELERARRTARRLRNLSVALVVLLVAALVAGSSAVLQGRAATEKAREARATALSAQAAGLVDSQQDLGGLLALAAERLHPSPQARAEIVAAANASPTLQSAARLGAAGSLTRGVSLDGRSAVVLGPDGRYRLLAVPSARVIAALPTTWTVDSIIAISASGRFVADDEDDGSGTSVVDVATGLVTRLDQRHFPVFLATDVLETSGPDGGPDYVDPRSGQTLGWTAVPPHSVAASSADGSVVAVSVPEGSSGGARTRVFARDPRLHEIGTGLPGALLGLSHDGVLVALYRAGGIDVVDRRSGRTVHFEDASSLDPRLLAYNSDLVGTFDRADDRFAFVSFETGNPVHVLDLASGTERVLPVPLPHATYRPVFDEDGRVIVQTAQGVAVFAVPPGRRAVTAATRQPRTEYRPAPREFVAVDRAGSSILTAAPAASGDGLERYRVTDDRLRARGPVIQPRPGRVFDGSTAAFSQDGRRLAVLELSLDAPVMGTISIWSTTTGARLREVGPFPAAAVRDADPATTRVAFAGGPNRVGLITSTGSAASGAYSTLRVWDLHSTSNDPAVVQALGSVGLAAFSPTGDAIATVDDEVLTLSSTRDGLWQQDPAPGPGATAADYSALRYTPDGRYVVAGGSRARKVVLWDTAHRFAMRRVRLPGVVGAGAWSASPRGDQVADIGRTGVEFRSATTGRLVTTVTAASTVIDLLGFTHDGTAVIGWDGEHLQYVTRAGQAVAIGPAYAATSATVVPDDPEIAVLPTGFVSSVVSGVSVVDDVYTTGLGAAEHRICELAGRGLSRAEWSRYVPDAPYERLCA